MKNKKNVTGKDLLIQLMHLDGHIRDNHKQKLGLLSRRKEITNEFHNMGNPQNWIDEEIPYVFTESQFTLTLGKMEVYLVEVDSEDGEIKITKLINIIV